MIWKLFIALFAIVLFSCSSNKKIKDPNEIIVSKERDSIPPCLSAKIDSMAAEYPNGAPQAIARYQYHGQTVYYMTAPCCDKFNIVFDNDCKILGYPDGGYTGRGDGKMPDFKKEATDKKVMWEFKKDEKGISN